MKLRRHIISIVSRQTVCLLGLLAAGLALDGSPLHGQEPARLNDESAPFAYDAHAPIPTSDKQLAEAISIDYRQAPEEFTAREIFNKLKPVIKKEKAKAKAASRWELKFATELRPYDFDQDAFPTGLQEATFIPLGTDYAVMFANAEQCRWLPVSLQTAKGIAEVLQSGRTVNVTLQGKLLESFERRLGGSPKKVLWMQIESLKVVLRDGTPVGKLAIEKTTN